MTTLEIITLKATLKERLKGLDVKVIRSLNGYLCIGIGAHFRDRHKQFDKAYIIFRDCGIDVVPTGTQFILPERYSFLIGDYFDDC